MKMLILAVIANFLFIPVQSQNMSAERLGELIGEVSDSVQQSGNRWQFVIEDRVLLCIVDESANRMRIISPIAEREKLDEELLLNALVANFHTALDVKYAISDEILWSVFLHPLKELSDAQAKDAILQVYYANLTFGTTFSSTHLVFPGNTKKKDPEKKQKI